MVVKTLEKKKKVQKSKSGIQNSEFRIQKEEKAEVKVKRKRKKRLTKDEKFMKYQEDMIEQYKYLVEYLSRKYSYKGEPIDDIRQIGMIGLLKAIRRFDVSQEFKFPTYAMPTIEGEIRHYLRDKGNAIKIPIRRSVKFTPA